MWSVWYPDLQSASEQLYKCNPSCFHSYPAWWVCDLPNYRVTSGCIQGRVQWIKVHTRADTQIHTHNNAAAVYRGFTKVLYLIPSGQGRIAATAGSPISWLDCWEFEGKKNTTTIRGGWRRIQTKRQNYTKTDRFFLFVWCFSENKAKTCFRGRDRLTIIILYSVQHSNQFFLCSLSLE